MKIETQDVGTTPRAKLTPRKKLAIWERHKGICVLCNGKIDGVRERWVAEHIIPLSLGGADDESNMAPVHEGCALAKTFGKSGDIAKAAKAKRVKTKHLGIKKSKNPLPGGKGSKWKRKINGEIVAREN